jgi:hypothetical protein
MQPVITATRDDLTRAQVIDLIQNSPALEVGAGMELLNSNLEVLEDLTDYLENGSVTHSNYSVLHNSCQFKISQQLNWGSAIIRPYMILQKGTIQARFNLGAYFTNTPQHVTGQTPTTYDVQGYDILDRLTAPLGDSYAVNAGVSYLDVVEQILSNQGYTQFIIDPDRAEATLPTARGWAMSDNATWLNIVNDLLSAVGYRGIYSDWDGRLICEPYKEPELRQVEWMYTDDTLTTQLDPSQVINHDFYATPNQWIGVRTNMPEGQSPAEGNGIYIYTNEFDGETSVEARGNRIIPTRLDIEAADQAALITTVRKAAEAAKTVGTTIECGTTPNPLHWHFDFLSLATEAIGTYRLQSVEWTLPFDGSSMTHRWAVI